MTATFRAGLVALLGLGLFAPTAVALSKPALAPASKGQMKVQDDGQVFSADAVTKAEAKFNGVTFKAPTHLTVRTFAAVPANRKADYDKVKDDKTKKRTFMKDWARELAQGEGEKGVFVMACMESRSIEVIADHKTDLYQHFTDQDADKAYDILSGAFKSAAEAKEKSEDEKRAIRGDGLVRVADFVISQLKNQTAPAEKGNTTGTTGGTHAGGDEPKKSTGWPIWLWIVTIIGILLVIWIIVALIRAMTGNVYGGMYAGGGYGYGGGPGFFGCFMGGMFGAMAGMWMYNSMMGTHYAYDPSVAGTDGNWGADGQPTDTGEGDFDNGAEAGGDWDDGGGDAGGDGGGGGGDWGDSGGDTGGGGDWGGDGGGGDWGGDSGGGGDFGGGGDW